MAAETVRRGYVGQNTVSIRTSKKFRSTSSLMAQENLGVCSPCSGWWCLPVDCCKTTAKKPSKNTKLHLIFWRPYKLQHFGEVLALILKYDLKKVKSTMKWANALHPLTWINIILKFKLVIVIAKKFEVWIWIDMHLSKIQTWAKNDILERFVQYNNNLLCHHLEILGLLLHRRIVVFKHDLKHYFINVYNIPTTNNKHAFKDKHKIIK